MVLYTSIKGYATYVLVMDWAVMCNCKMAVRCVQRSKDATDKKEILEKCTPAVHKQAPSQIAPHKPMSGGHCISKQVSSSNPEILTIIASAPGSSLSIRRRRRRRRTVPTMRRRMAMSRQAHSQE